ncbi:hypothetical protein NADFUDRAFT_49163 [Nadsonia fulvescens var. elongata DSM 6958]|uniref:Uncharacterized protein n=1 Tax=Nadsonia fulvescens var. elongata DSM 6958 TaxID=857566 RepID=A0A1E3PSX3_9ASCO|nr:hypothetical protein NADFUDRAFT_49163 [Nadsonia fulvescens var. elongata DSM 6958]
MGSCLSKSSDTPSASRTRRPPRSKLVNVAAKSKQQSSGYTGQGRRLGGPADASESRPATQEANPHDINVASGSISSSAVEMSELIRPDQVGEDARARAALAAQKRFTTSGTPNSSGKKGKLGEKLDNELRKGKNTLLMEHAREKEAERKNKQLVFD